jgi:hypothetical protein
MIAIHAAARRAYLRWSGEALDKAVAEIRAARQGNACIHVADYFQRKADSFGQMYDFASREADTRGVR